MIDQTDMSILRLLSENSRMQWQEIGEAVHMTGQAVRNRIRRLEKLGVIEGYTLKLNDAQIGRNVTAYITVFMKTTEHASFRKVLHECPLIAEAHRISGEGCYLLKAVASGQQELVDLLEELLHFGNYKVNLSIEKVK
jgi:Lrp/AsnC family leucine-responsive transcriptional regulator